MIARLQLMKVHALLAAFILPVAVMFMITGGLYTWGIKGSYMDGVHELRMGEQLRPELAGPTAISGRTREAGRGSTGRRAEAETRW